MGERTREGSDLWREMTESGVISKTALVLVGDFLSHQYQRSLLYHPGFSTEYRTGDGSAEPGGSL